MDKGALIDTDMLIDLARGKEGIAAHLEKLKKTGNLYISVVTYMELVVGCRNKSEQRFVDKLVEKFTVVNIDASISETAMRFLKKYKLSHGLLIPDALIAATAATLEIGLLTWNRKDYRFIDGLAMLPAPRAARK